MPQGCYKQVQDFHDIKLLRFKRYKAINVRPPCNKWIDKQQKIRLWSCKVVTIRLQRSKEVDQEWQLKLKPWTINRRPPCNKRLDKEQQHTWIYIEKRCVLKNLLCTSYFTANVIASQSSWVMKPCVWVLRSMHIAFRWDPALVSCWASKTRCSTPLLRSGCQCSLIWSWSRSQMDLKTSNASDRKAMSGSM